MRKEHSMGGLPMIDRVGQQLGNYRLVSLLGQGGYAEVYLGQHVRLNQQAAIKVLHAHLTQAEAERFQQEAQTIATLVHPGIVRVFDYDVHDGVPFLVIDYAPGGTLRRHYPKGSLVPLPIILSSVKQVADALQYAHEQKFIHRDVKPENMLVGKRQEVLLSDFGIATIALSTSLMGVATEGASGTLAYMAPEQIEGHPRVASDQYALGVVVYEWLCGERPFEGSASEVMAQHLSMPPLPLHERVPSIPGEVELVVLQALAKDPKQRFASVQDFAVALEVASIAASPGSTRLMLASGYTSEILLTTKYHLPAYLTPLLGREQEIADACTLLRRSDVRLVTLTGTGGIGKTRLAVQVATELVAEFPGGVSFVSLAPISNPDLVIPTIAQTFDVKESGTRPLMDLLKAFLQDKHLLLVLDNFEHLLPAASQLADLLTSCPHLNILVTSRATLHVQGEHEFLVPPLMVPDLTHLLAQDVLPQYAAVALFLQRAQAVKPAFQLTPTNAHSIAEICARLDGLPLAIELAASRIKLLSPQALLTRLSQRLLLLTGGARDAPARQQTLRNTIEWSYQLLDTQEQQLFRRLCIFVGGCSLEAIEAIFTIFESDSTVVPVLESVSSLINKSLLQLTEQEGEEPRLMMLESIREYGLEALATNGEMEATRDAHVSYYLALAERAVQELRGPQQALWLKQLEREHDNLRFALQCSLERVAMDQGMETALRFGRALTDFWKIRGFYNEGRTLLHEILAHNKESITSIRAQVLNDAAGLAEAQGDYVQAEELCKESLTLARRLGDTQNIAASLALLADVSLNNDDPSMARTCMEESLALYRELGDMNGVAHGLYELGWQCKLQEEYMQARAFLEESLVIRREQGDGGGIAHTLFQLAEVLFQVQGESKAVRSLLEESRTLFEEVGDKEGIAYVFDLSGKIALVREDMNRAQSQFEAAFTLYREIGDVPAMSSVLYTLALAALAQDNYLWAAQLWGAADTLREIIGASFSSDQRANYERSVAVAQAQLGKQAFVDAWEEGRTMTAEQALAAQGRTLVSTVTPISPVAMSVPPAKSPTTYPAGLTAHKVEVLGLVAQGLKLF
jgi:predicted ATPase/tRNA A-37 threonylcarbamoyl transferase component Bud32